MPVADAPLMLIRLFVIAVVPVTVTARTKFLIQLKSVPVVVGIGVGVVPANESSLLKTPPLSAFAHETLEPVPICACTVAAPIFLYLFFCQNCMNSIRNNLEKLIVNTISFFIDFKPFFNACLTAF